VTTTVWGSGLLEKLIVAKLVKKFPAFYGTTIHEHNSPLLELSRYKRNVHPGSRFSKDTF
jgi:hypothetical protein